jgi:hypothetical protein
MALFRLALAMNRYSKCNSLLLILTAVILYILFTPVNMYADYYGGYIGPYSDEQHEEACVEIAPNTTFDIWIFVLPAWRGALGICYSVQYCDNVVQVEEEYSPLFLENTIFGNLDDGFIAIFEECQNDNDFIWVARQTLYMTDDQGCEIRVREAQGLAMPAVLACDNNEYWLTEYVRLAVNLPCGPISTESSSWGVIKSLYK